MGLAIVEAAGLAVPVADLKAYLRIDSGGEDMLLERLIRAATDLCERFIGQWLIVRAGEDVMPVRTGTWQRLDARPVVAIESVTGVPAEGAAFALAVDAYAIDIDRHGDGWVRVMEPGAAGRIRVRYRAGIADDAAAIPEGIRHGIVRMAAEMHGLREGDAATPPAAVTALWRPWRRMRLA
ncbi:head-tail connector protein [Sphingobium algorifonticola]|uniref:Phage gp6-like head-tail connector protein n=1 Tax=Sphingobium algorifonticola TaxID=2008318 RepID=A0A437JCF8_9SPHN|nr:head-tail connector protein [Sphingobium algorifonticola]RVT43430.1 hypothetical protein ENE74_02030 [Sphingobium algorifonticola]